MPYAFLFSQSEPLLSSLTLSVSNQKPGWRWGARGMRPAQRTEGGGVWPGQCEKEGGVSVAEPG